MGILLFTLLHSIYFLRIFACCNRILMLHETGLLHFWGEQMQQTRPCYNDEGVNRQRTKLLVRLSLANLASAFTLLAVGYLISLFLFVIELITYRHLNQRVTIKSDV